jgi:hypothetical protein
MHASLPEVYLARHGETAWTITGQHTGRTDIPLTARGEQNTLSLRQRLNGVTFAKVLVSPLVRARRTYELVGFGDTGEVAPERHEWDYGDDEGGAPPTSATSGPAGISSAMAAPAPKRCWRSSGATSSAPGPSWCSSARGVHPHDHPGHPGPRRRRHPL